MISYFKNARDLFFLTFIFPFLAGIAGAEPDLKTVRQAEKLFYEKLYESAIPFYSQLFAVSQNNELKTQWALRLATCHLEEERPQEALALLSSLDTFSYRNQLLYLTSLAYRQLEQSPKALFLLQQCSLPQSEHAAQLMTLEKSFHLIHIGDFTNAQLLLKSIRLEAHDPIIYELAQLQLAKIFLINHQYHEALEVLEVLFSSSQKNLLSIEKLYLRGWALLGLQQESEAILCFEEILPKALNAHTSWSTKILNSLIVSYLRLAIKTDCQQLRLETQSIDTRSMIALQKAAPLLQQLIKQEPTEASYLLLSDFYLIKAKYLGDPLSYAEAQLMLDQQSNLFSSPDGLREALLKRAAAAPSYQKRSQLYEQLSTQSESPASFRTRALFLKGLNHFEEGLKNQKSIKKSTPSAFQEATQAFLQTIQIGTDPDQVALAHKYLVIAYIHLSDQTSSQLAWLTLNQLITNESLLFTIEHPEEIYCLLAWTALRLNDAEALKKAFALLEQTPSKSLFWQERYLKLQGLICLQLREWQQADLIFDCLIKNKLYPASLGEALFWRGFSAGQQEQESLKKEYFQQAYTQDPQSFYAPIAYYHFYSYRDYMQGKRKALKHLQAMPHLFPNHHLLISAHYLIGLHHKKDDLSEEGHVLRRKDWTTAIDAFQLAESSFNVFFEGNSIPSADLDYFIRIRYQAQLERAQANLAIAQSSRGGKRQIYLEYAEEVFKQLIEDFTTPQAIAEQRLVQPQSPYPKIWAEAELGLAKTYEEKNAWKEAENRLNKSLMHYQNSSITQGYGLMQIWYAKGKLAQLQKNFEAALNFFLEAEKAVQERLVLSPNEKLDLWIQQSLSYKELNKLEQAMRILSQVINDDVISPLRIKAMFLRAEIYELQGRPELAIKQLEATALKGGEWAQQAKEKLEKSYGY